jgi:hypothetical protein
MRKLFIATPTAANTVYVCFLEALLETQKFLKANDIDVEFKTLKCSDLPLARDTLIKMFLDSDCTDFIFIDSDMGWEPQSILKMLLCDEPVLCGVYPAKTKHRKFLIRLTPEGYAKKKGSLVEVDGAATGFLYFTREALQKLYNSYPETEYKEQTDKGRLLRGLSDRFIDGEGYRWGEDYSLCRRWQNIGGQIYAMPDITLMHTGDYSWVDNFQGFIDKEKPFKYNVEDIKSLDSDEVVTPSLAADVDCADKIKELLSMVESLKQGK